jgi:hypothetical protein
MHTHLKPEKSLFGTLYHRARYVWKWNDGTRYASGMILAELEKWEN